MGDWVHDFVDGQTKAVCSKCGVPFRFPDKLVRQNDGFFYCPKCLEQTVITRDRIMAQSRRRREMPPPKFVQPPAYAEDYRGAESAVVNQVASTYESLTDPADIGWAVNYLADILLQDERPTLWDTRAIPIVTELCDTLLTLQYGAPLGPAPTLTYDQLRYGGFAQGSWLTSYGTAVAGVALLKGYRTIGDPLYLEAASRCAHFLRHMQCQDLDNNNQRSLWNGGPYHVGGFAEGVTSSSGGGVSWSSRYAISNAVGVWFLDQLADIQGGSTQYGSASSPDFTASTVATLDEMIDEFLEFITVGPYDASQSSAKVTGLSTTYPRSVYLAQADGSANTGVWALSVAAGTPGQVMRGRDVALALFSLNQIGEATDQVNAVFDWLMSFTANPLNAAPEQDPSLLIGNLKGTYNPRMAIANELDVLSDAGLAMSQEHEGAAYDWSATALLAPIASVRLPANFKASKDQLSIMQPTSAGPVPLYTYTGVTNVSGLSFQAASASIGSSGSAARAIADGSVSGLMPPTDDMVLWFKPDVGVTMNANNEVSRWADQSPNQWDVVPEDIGGVILPTSQWPVYTPNVFGTLPGLLWVRGPAAFGTGTTLMHRYDMGAVDVPTPDGSPVTALALVKPSDIDGGDIFVLRLNGGDLEFALRTYPTQPLRQMPISTEVNNFGYVFTDATVDYTDQSLVLTWQYYGATPPLGSAAIPQVSINGLNRPLDPTWGPVRAYIGTPGFSLGYCNANFDTYFAGYIGEVLLYGGNNPATLAAASAYLNARAGNVDEPPKLLAYPYRWAPQSYGDRYRNPDQGPS